MNPTQSKMVQSAPAPIFFLHIPKTAGSALNDYCVDWFGPERTLLHVEGVLGAASLEHLDDVERWTGYDFVSGHLTVSLMHQLIDVGDWVTVTLVRDPFQQVLSHLMWAREIGRPGRSDFLAGYPVEWQNVSLGLRQYDLRSPRDLRSLIYWLETIGFDYFHDCQTLYLAGESRDVDRALENFFEFDIVGRTEDPGRVIEALAGSRGRARDQPESLKYVNVQTSVPRHVCDDPELRHALYPLVARDLPLYEAACRYLSREE